MSWAARPAWATNHEAWQAAVEEVCAVTGEEAPRAPVALKDPRPAGDRTMRLLLTEIKKQHQERCYRDQHGFTKADLEYIKAPQGLAPRLLPGQMSGSYN
jgi:hypothetical protein